MLHGQHRQRDLKAVAGARQCSPRPIAPSATGIIFCVHCRLLVCSVFGPVTILRMSLFCPSVASGSRFVLSVARLEELCMIVSGDDQRIYSSPVGNVRGSGSMCLHSRCASGAMVSAWGCSLSVGELTWRCTCISRHVFLLAILSQSCRPRRGSSFEGLSHSLCPSLGRCRPWGSSRDPRRCRSVWVSVRSFSCRLRRLYSLLACLLAPADSRAPLGRLDQTCPRPFGSSSGPLNRSALGASALHCGGRCAGFWCARVVFSSAAAIIERVGNGFVCATRRASFLHLAQISGRGGSSTRCGIDLHVVRHHDV